MFFVKKTRQIIIALSFFFFAGLIYHTINHVDEGFFQGAGFLTFACFYVLFILYSAYKDKRLFHARHKTLAQAISRSQFYYDHIPMGLMTLDENRCIIDTNPAMTKIFGYEKEEFIGKNTQFLHISPQAYKRFGLVYTQEYYESVDPVVMEIQLKHKNGLLIWVEVIGIHPHSRTEDVFSIWSARNIDERVAARETIKSLNTELSSNNRQLQTLLNTVPIPIYFQDSDFYYRDCNNAFAQLLKKRKSDIIGSKVFAHFPEEKALELHHYDEQMQMEKSQIFKTIISFGGEPPRSIEYHKTSLRQFDTFKGLVGAMLDVTEQDLYEEQLKQRIEEEVTRNLEQEKIHQKEQLRNVKFASIGKLAAGITHEINTPLTYIKGNFEMLREDIHALNDTCKEQMLEDCQSIQSGIDRIAHIVEAMREMSQKSHGTKTQTNLYATLVFALTVANNRAKHITEITLQGQPFTLDTPKDQYTFEAYVQPQRIEQVWVIIINNALDELIKIDGFENRRLSITLIDDKQTVIVRFEDNAGGIKEEIFPILFEPFTSTKDSSGIGIGLNIAQQIIEEHHGTIVAFNESEGAVFEVILPKTNKAL